MAAMMSGGAPGTAMGLVQIVSGDPVLPIANLSGPARGRTPSLFRPECRAVYPDVPAGVVVFRRADRSSKRTNATRPNGSENKSSAWDFRPDAAVALDISPNNVVLFAASGERSSVPAGSGFQQGV